MDNSSPKSHQAKVCSVLLPLYPAVDYQTKDQFKGYDKCGAAPIRNQEKFLPKWNISPERVAKYRGK